MQIRFRNYAVIGILSLLSVVSGHTVCAQGAADFRFNEVLIHNTSSYVDDYGNRLPWIEIVNTSHSNVNIAGCYLTDDKNNLKKYWIPTDSPSTMTSPRGFVLFFGSDRSSQSIYHLNFNLQEGETIYLVNGDGKEIIDELVIPSQIPNDVVYARTSVDVNQWTLTDHPTPLSNNDHSRRASSGEKFVEHDPSGLGMVFVAMTVVFSVLAILSIFYLLIGRFFTRSIVISKPQVEGANAKPEKAVLSGEINAAIALTIYQYQNEIHDYENTVLTINKSVKPYSPWNSKLQMVNKFPERK
ncbi:MAG: OadG family transporter subunit [Mangrovibacterium sp.]